MDAHLSELGGNLSETKGKDDGHLFAGPVNDCNCGLHNGLEDKSKDGISLVVSIWLNCELASNNNDQTITTLARCAS